MKILINFNFNCISMLLIISHEGNLRQKYSDPYFNKIKNSLEKLRDTIKNEGINTSLVFVDNPQSTNPINLTKVQNDSSDAILDLIQQFYKNNTNLKYLLIVGGHQIIPFHTIQQSHVDNSDHLVYSDAPYASSDNDFLLPEWIVGRIPDGKSNDSNFLISELETAINAHSSHTNHKVKSMGCVASSWQLPSQRIYENISQSHSLLINPSTTVSSNNIKDCLYHYFNLHGNQTSKFWYGADGRNLSAAVSTDVINTTKVPNAIVISQACYGAYIIQKNPDNAISLMYLKMGAKCVIGSTATAYGNNGTSPILYYSDLIADKFLRKIACGKKCGDAFIETKIEYYQESLQNNDKYAEKTLIEFVLYGDPTL